MSWYVVRLWDDLPDAASGMNADSRLEAFAVFERAARGKLGRSLGKQDWTPESRLYGTVYDATEIKSWRYYAGQKPTPIAWITIGPRGGLHWTTEHPFPERR